MLTVTTTADVTMSPRSRALHAARRVFAASGYDGGSLNEVAAAAGMSRHNLLYYFPSKRELLIAVLEERDVRADARLQWLESNKGYAFRDVLDGLTRLAPEIYGDRVLVELYHRLRTESADPSHPAHEWVHDRYHRVRTALGALLRRAQEAGEIRAEIDLVDTSVVLLGAIEGIEAQWLVEPTLDWTRATGALRALVEQGLAVSDD